MSAIIRSIKDALSFMGKHGIWKSLKMKDAPWLIQFSKYVMCGVLAVIVHNLVFFACASTFLPCLDEAMPEWNRAWNWLGANLIGFAFSNVLTYFTNVKLVFEGGRHSGKKEFALFSAVSFGATAPGLLIGFIAIIRGTSTPYAQAIFIIVSAMVNYLSRKFFIFKG